MPDPYFHILFNIFTFPPSFPYLSSLDSTQFLIMSSFPCPSCQGMTALNQPIINNSIPIPTAIGVTSCGARAPLLFDFQLFNFSGHF